MSSETISAAVPDGNNEPSAMLQQDVIVENQVSPVIPSASRRLSLARHRKKSRRMTLTHQLSCDHQDAPTKELLEEDGMSCVSAASPDSTTPTPTADRKISRIFSMLQSMQQTFIQQTLIPSAMPSAEPSPSISRVNSFQPQQQRFYAMGHSQDSMRLDHPQRPLRNPAIDRLNRFGSVNSWTGSECSQVSSCTTTSSASSCAPPPLIHAVPYHKDGWTSFFIVASSTYAQLLIVVCIVSALSEVVTHNVPFLFFEGFFTYLYTGSILFFLYVFGYLLRSKQRKELKRRQRKLNKWREASSCNDVRRSASVMVGVEEDTVVTSSSSSAPHRFIDSIKNYRRRVSSVIPVPTEVTCAAPPGKTFEWSASAMSLNLNGAEETRAAVLHAMNGNNVIAKSKKMKVSDNDHSHGSFFLRAGAVAFGLGTMIYDGLEFGAFLEVPPDSPCFAMLRGLNPVLHATFAFLQMYLIFVSARLNIHKFKVIARFGLMHCLATNVCVWVRTLVRESLKEINGHYHHYEKNHEHSTIASAHLHQPVTIGTTTTAASTSTISSSTVSTTTETLRQIFDWNATDYDSSMFELVNETMEALTAAASHDHLQDDGHQSLWELTGNVSCGRRIFLGDVIMDAAPFLYPFLIEYSLIGAAVLYVLWAHIGFNPKYKTDVNQSDDRKATNKAHQLRVDCMGASKGLFFGLFFLVVSLLCLVLFFIFVPQQEFRRLGLFMADSAHCTLLLVSLMAMAIGVYRARHLQFNPAHSEELDSTLLRVSALGIYTYSVFSMIAGALAEPTTDEPPLLVLVNGLLSVIEVTAQMLFISDMSRKRVSCEEEDRTKPGRQSVTFLLISNLTLWLVYTFEMQKVEANPVQLKFYGFLPWAIVQRITLPLCIFYRFHSAIVYAEIWKNSYRFNGAAGGQPVHMDDDVLPTSLAMS